jgi:soluble lytic murein transglycosylase-like protein
VAFRIPNSEFRIPSWLLWAIAIMIAIAPNAADAKLAIFVDGRVLKVADARLEGAEIVLELRGGGSLRVPALRIDRVIADEVETDITEDLDDPACPARWTDDPLPAEIPFRTSVRDAARTSDLHPWLVAAVVQTESAFDPRAVSRAGAAGLMQLMPAAAADHGVEDVFDPVDNLRGGAAHLRLMLDRFESLSLALAAYNSGATTVERYKGIPPYEETRNYVRRVLEIFCPEE